MLPLMAAARSGGALAAAAIASPALLRAAARWASLAPGVAPAAVPSSQLGPASLPRGFSAGPGGAPQQQQGQQQQQQQQPQPGVPPLSKSFVAGKLSQEELWMAGLPGKLKIWSARTRPQLKGREMEVVDEVRNKYYQLMAAHATGRLLSHQARAQLKLACLAAATHDVLMRETGGDEAAIEEHIKQSMGSLYAPFLLGSLKAVGWVKRTLFNEAPFKLAMGTLKDIAKDMEGGCACSVTEDAAAGRGALTVDACLFQEVLAAEGKPQLLKHLCCQHNAAWLDAYGRLGVSHSLPSAKARGDAQCVIEIAAEGCKKG